MTAAWFTGVLLALVLVQGPAAVRAAGNAKHTPIWQDLFVSDCTGGVHCLPSSPAAVHMDFSTFQDVFKSFTKEVT